MIRQIFLHCMLFCTLGGIVACGANETLPAAGPAQPTPALRVVVTFKQSQRFADKELLNAMQQHANARFSYVAAVSPLTHIYRLEPIAPQTSDAALAALQQWAAVQQASPDAKERN